jgi:hypothetical protein
MDAGHVIAFDIPPAGRVLMLARQVDRILVVDCC